MTGRLIRLLAVVVSLSTLLFVGAAAATSSNAATSAATAAPATAPVTGSTSDGGTFKGTFDPSRFAVQDGDLVAVGELTGTLTSAAGGTRAVDETVTLPVNTAASTGSCQILDLVLGPLDLDLLGLVVHLDTVHLNITAEPGPGNLLGNLLCAVAGLLDGTGLNGLLGQLASLLNQILAILG